MNISAANHRYARLGRSLLVAAIWAAASQLVGCEVDGFFDPSKTGRFEFTPTTIPVLERIDVIEPEEELWGQTTGVRPDDLLPSDLTYYMSAGDVLTVEIFELYAEDQWSSSTRRIDAGGYLRVPELGDVPAAGLTAQEFEDELKRLLEERFIQDPQVDVVIQEFSGFTFTVYGSVDAPGVYTLRNPDLRLLDAIAIAGGAPQVTRKIYVVREIALSEDVKPTWETGRRPARPRDDEATPPADIEDLIEQLPDDGKEGGTPPNLGAFQDEGRDEPPVDIEEVEPERRGDFYFDEEQGEWIGPELILERIIEIPYDRLSQGDSTFNIVIRPNDRVYVETPTIGFVYIDGEVGRPGVYNLPNAGKLTLSRLVAAAGGLGALAIPERVDLTRVVGPNKEATIRLNLGAIRARTEPDVVLKGDDHVIIGTNFWAAPLAVFRNGFRVTYGFGFLLDRNFGNDVFGPPPEDRGF